MLSQLRSYERILVGLSRKEEKYTSVVHDLDFGISWLNRNKLWYLPYVVHLAIGLVLALGFGWWLLGACYFFGIMSHPLEGWAVNAFGHAYGGRNFDTAELITSWPVIWSSCSRMSTTRTSTCRLNVWIA